MGFLKNVKQAVNNARTGTVDLSTLTPEQRARYDENMARVAAAQAESQTSWEQSQAITQAARENFVLRGPAGDHLHGVPDTTSPDDLQRQMAEQGTWSVVRQIGQQRAQEFGQVAKQTVQPFDGPEEVDPTRRSQIMAAERAARDQARAPYLPAAPPPMAISRLATRGATQVGELIAWLGISGLAARPDLVYGVYRVPDRVSPTLTLHSERGRIVEWDVVHVPVELPPAPPLVTAALFPARAQWVARGIGEPSLLDEDLAGLYCAWAGVGPEQCFGLARHVHIRQAGRHASEDDSTLYTVVEGIYALHAPTPDAGPMLERMVDNMPLEIPLDSAPPANVVVLDWQEVARVVHPQAQKPPRIPSPFPYLPSTPQELLAAYLQVVGIASADCYSAQVTVYDPREINGSFAWGGSVNFGPKQPCADGKDRMRMAGATCVVIAHRDRPEYEAGRERWAAYQRDVLQARFDLPTGRREPLYATDNSDIVNPMLRAAAKAASAVDSLTDWAEGVEHIPPFRYCWPPVQR